MGKFRSGASRVRANLLRHLSTHSFVDIATTLMPMRTFGRAILGSTLFLSAIVVGVKPGVPVGSESLSVRSTPDCADLPVKVPNDLSIYYIMEGSMKMGPQFYRIDPMGDGKFTFANGTENHLRRPITRDSTVWQLTLDQVQKIYDIVRMRDCRRKSAMWQ